MSEIEVTNFRSIKSAKLDLSSYTPLVGYNNAGKTNLMSALQWGLRKRVLTALDFNDQHEAVCVTLQISGVSTAVLDALEAKHRTKIEPYVSDNCISIRRTQSAPSVPSKEVRLEVFKPEPDVSEWTLNPTGIENALAALFPDPIFIGAMENATEDVAKYGASTVIGKLIKEIIEPVGQRHSDAISDALEDISSRLSADGAKKDEDLVRLDAKIQTELNRFFPGVQAKTHIPTPEFDDFLRNATVKIYDTGNENPEGRTASQFGHGAQRSLQMALIKCLSEVRRDTVGGEARTTLLLIDEPELYLHPQAVEALRASLSNLSKDRYQIVFSTHSGAMITREDAPNVLIVRRSEGAGTYVNQRLAQAVRAAVDSADHQSELLFSLTVSNEIFFSEKILLVEGKTERIMIPELFRYVTDETPASNKVAIVELKGSENVPKTMRILESMGLTVKALVDFDFAFQVALASGYLSRSDPNVEKCINKFKAFSDEGIATLNEDGKPTRKSSEGLPNIYKRLFEDAETSSAVTEIHETLKRQNIWSWKYGTIENQLGMPVKSDAEQVRFLKELSTPGFTDGLPGYGLVEELVAWLLE